MGLSAAMFGQAWSHLLHLFALVQQIFSPCVHRERLVVNSLDQQQYLGKWFFRAAVSPREADIRKFEMFDNIVFTMESRTNTTLFLTGYMRLGDNCIKHNWTYSLQPGRDELVLEGRPHRRNLLWSGIWANCRDCIVFQETEALNEADSVDSLNRFMLYAREKDVDPEKLTAFLRNSDCQGLTQSVTLPNEKEGCI